MKRMVCMLMVIVLCLVTFSPITAYAQTYHLGETDMSIQVDDAFWYVFTRDNIKDNPEMEELGMSYDAMQDFFYENEAYMDAVLYYEDGEYIELLVRKRAIDSGMANLSNYSEKEVLKLAQGLAERLATEDYSVYESQYKFAVVEYMDEELGYYVCEFVTVVNQENYTLTFQSTVPFGDWEYGEIKNIVDSVRFEVDTSLKEKGFSPDWGSVAGSALVGAIAGGVGAGVLGLIKKKKKVDTNTMEDSVDDTGLH